ncbi:putative ribonuclease H-like domain-containing protein [Tanacetum coccineum]
MNVSPIPTTRIDKDHPKDQIIGDLNSAIQTRRMTKISDEHAMVSYINMQRRINYKDYQNCLFACFLSQKEPKKVIQALADPTWVEAITKWVFRNKKDERGIVVRNKARLVAQGYTQEEGITYDEVFALVARIEAIRLFLACASFMGFIVYQMDVKSAFLYGTIEEEVYVCQPPGFEDPHFLDKVYKVEKALYGLDQAPRAWYETLSTYLIENGFRRGTIDKTLFIKKDKGDILFDVQEIPDKFYGGTHFLLRIATSTPIETNKALVKDEEAEAVDVHLFRSLMYLTASRPDIMFVVYSPFDLKAFSDSDYAGASLDRKSTTGEYIATANCCGQVLWIQNQMLDYGFNFINTKIYIDNESTICIRKNPVFHSKTKHIEIRHHFIRDSYEKKLIQVIKIHTDHNVLMLADETVYKEWEDRIERAATTASSLEAEQDSDAQTRFESASKQSNDPPLSRVNTLGSREDNMKLNELMELCTKFSGATAKKDEPIIEKETNEEFVPKHSYDPSQSGEDRMQLHEFTNLCTKLSDRVLSLETIKTTQALEIASLKNRVKKREKKAKDASKQGRSIEDIDNDAKVSLVDETQGRSDDKEMFDTDALIGDDVFAENDMTEKEHDVIPKEVSAAEILTTAGIKIPVSTTAISTTAPFTIDVSPPVITESTVTTIPSTILKAKGITFRDAGETTTRTPTLVSSLRIKDKGKAKMDEPKVPLNKKDQIRLDEELARRLDFKEQEAIRLERENQKQGELTIEEKSKLFMELMNERKRHFAKLRAEEKRRKPLTKDSEEVKSSEKKVEGSRKKSIGKKRAGNEQKQESSKRQRMKDDKEKDEHEEAEEDDEAEMKKHMEIVQDKEEIAIDVIPLTTKSPMIVEYKIIKEGHKGFYHLIRADGSSKRYSSMIKMLQNIDREDLETLWKLVKAKHGNTRPEDDYERVFWGDLKVMFEPDIKSEVWRSLQGYKVTVWKLFDSCGAETLGMEARVIGTAVSDMVPAKTSKSDSTIPTSSIRFPPFLHQAEEVETRD